MGESSLFLIGADTDLSPQLSGLLGMLRYARNVTLETVAGLTTAQLDLEYAGGTSIAALLRHIAAVEVWFQVETFESRGWNRDESAQWKVAMQLGPDANRQARGCSLDEHVARLVEVRARSERELRARDDAWLAAVVPFRGLQANNHWKWFHVLEEEIHHRGQIGWLRRRVLELA
jgi:uncharacterized damage-inducible protein DinB